MATITNVKTVNAKSKTHTVEHVRGNMYNVTSGASGETYSVTMFERGGVCTCKWGNYRNWTDPRSGCSHVQAVVAVINAEAGRKVTAHESMEDAKRQHRPVIAIGDGVVLTSRLAVKVG